MPDPHEALHEALGDRYEIQKVLGEGGMGTEREIQSTAHLQHPHILSLLNSSVAGTLYYVMPSVEGESLKERLEKERQLPEEPRSLR